MLIMIDFGPQRSHGYQCVEEVILKCVVSFLQVRNNKFYARQIVFNSVNLKFLEYLSLINCIGNIII